ncbi:MAG: hypothetical protein AAF747_03470, partial [Planctomycetota bacterium]
MQEQQTHLRGLPRRTFLGTAGLTTAGLVLAAGCGSAAQQNAPNDADETSPDDASSTQAQLFRISLAQWSLVKLFRSGELDNLDFAAEAKRTGFDAIEYVNGFFKDKANDDR